MLLGIEVVLGCFSSEVLLLGMARVFLIVGGCGFRLGVLWLQSVGFIGFIGFLGFRVYRVHRVFRV